MKSACFVTPLGLAAIVFASCARQPQESVAAARAGAEDVQQMLTGTEREKAVDLASGRWTERWVADDFVITSADGQVHSSTKKQGLDDIRSGAWKVETVSIDNVNVRVFGNAAVVTATQTEKSQFKGKDSGGKFQYTHVWVKRDGRWQVVAAHVTLLQ